jgi:hypothetical protein
MSGISHMEKHHIVVEVKRLDRPDYKRRTYTVEAPSREEAVREALTIAREEWSDARLAGPVLWDDKELF